MELLRLYLNPPNWANRITDIARKARSGQRSDSIRQQPLRRARRLIDAELAELVAGYQAGVQANEMARRFQIHRHTVAELLDRLGVQRRRRGLTSDQVARACRLYRDGWSLATIGDEFGVTANTVRRYLLMAGVVMRSANHRPS